MLRFSVLGLSTLCGFGLCFPRLVFALSLLCFASSFALAFFILRGLIVVAILGLDLGFAL